MSKKRFSLIALLLPFALTAQVNTASLSGVVKDATQAAVGKAKVAVTHKATGVDRATETDGAGNYFFPSLPVGDYDLRVEAPGFKKTEVALTLETGQKGRQDISLSVGSLETSVTVESTVSQLSPQDASLGSVVDGNSISRFPLLLRNWDDLLAVMPGVQGSRFTSQGGGTSFNRTGGFSVHGVHSMQNNFMLDGIDNNSISENVQELTTQVVRPSIDTIAEFKVTTNPYSAELGRSPGGAISVTTKGGTNQIHGVAYEYLRNRVLDANDFFSNRSGLAKPQNVQNQFGGNVGGPAVKNKLFFFFDYEGTRIRKGVSRLTTVPLDNERAGVFTTAASGAAKVAYPTLYDPTTGQPFADNTIPTNRVDPFSRKLFDLFPHPTDPTRQTNNFARNAGLLDDTDRYNIRSDWQASSKDSVFWRYSFSIRDTFTPGNFGGIADGTSSSSAGAYHLTAHGIALGWTHVFSPTVVNEFRGGFLRNNSFARQDPFGQNKASDYVPGVPDVASVAGGVTRTTFTSFDSFVGSPDFLPKFQIAQQYQFTDSVSYTRGKHQLKLGADLRLPLRNNFQDVPATRGQMNFDRIFTCQRTATGCVAGTGLSYADGLLGYVQQAALTNVLVVDQRLSMYSFFVQDDFKLAPRLTLNIGMRYDYSSPVVDAKNRLANFNPAGTGSLILAKSGSIEDRALVRPDKNNWAPRAGLAYQINQKTVWRMGYGIFYALFDRNGSEDQLALNPPNLVNNNISLGATASAPLFLVKNGFPSNFLDPNAPGLLTRVRVRAANPNAPNAYVQQWSAGIQRELPMHLFVEADYVGTKSTRLNTLRNYNQPLVPNGPLPYPDFQQIEYRDPLGNSVYHGLDLIVERRFATGLTFRSAVTISRSIDNAPDQLNTNASFGQNGRDFKSWRGPSDFNVPRRWVTSFVYELPFGKGKRWASTGIGSYVIGGWQMSGGVTFQDGRPFTPTANSNNSAIDRGLQTALPSVVGPAFVPGDVDCYFYSSRRSACKSLFPNATDFLVIPTPAAYGNVGRNILTAPGTKIADFGLHKDFVFMESRSLQFRWEMFNLANTTHLGFPNRDASGGSGGSITSLGTDARIMQFALRLKF